jgi:hypothetical protein
MQFTLNKCKCEEIEAFEQIKKINTYIFKMHNKW